MFRLISRPRWSADGAGFVAAESLALSALLLLGFHVLRDADLVRVEPWQPVAAVGAGLAAYWALQTLVGDRIAFWLIAPAVAFPHIAPAWSHNRIGWHELLRYQEALVAGRSAYWDLALFVGCLVILMALHRFIGIKRVSRQMLLRQVDPQERRLVVRSELLLVIALIVAGLLATGATVVVAAVLARNDGLLDGSSLAIATIGGGAAVALVLTLWLWFRRGSEALTSERPPDVIR